MTMELMKAIHISASGMKAQGTRLRVTAENLANSDSLAKTAEGEPYRRKIITFESELDRKLNANLVQIGDVGRDKSDFDLTYEPNHPLANEDGYLKRPNVNALIEMMDLREARRSYEANMTVIENSRSMMQRTIDLLRA